MTAISNRAVMVVFGGNRERMREMAFGSQVLNDYEETNGILSGNRKLSDGRRMCMVLCAVNSEKKT